MIAARGVSVSFNGTRALAGLNLMVPKGSWVCLIGPNGSGKTTFLRTVSGQTDFTGELEVGGVSLRDMRRREVARRIAVVPQHPIIPEAMRVTDYVLMGRTPYISYLSMESANDLAIVAEVLGQLDLEEFAERSLGSLSGGELQRVILARALAQQAPVLLLDEPTSALDVGHQQQVLELVEQLRIRRGLTVLSAMHDLTLAGQFAEHLLLLNRGATVAEGSPQNVLTEAAIREHYGASVRVQTDPDGGVAVIPRRRSS